MPSWISKNRVTGIESHSYVNARVQESVVADWN